MATRPEKRSVTIRRVASREPVSPADAAAATRILARLIARAYLADHPELLHPDPPGPDNGHDPRHSLPGAGVTGIQSRRAADSPLPAGEPAAHNTEQADDTASRDG